MYVLHQFNMILKTQKPDVFTGTCRISFILQIFQYQKKKRKKEEGGTELGTAWKMQVV